MATIKSYTDLSQSKTLSKILPLESADMVYTMTNGYHTPFIRIETIQEMDKDDVCAWSLAALLSVLPFPQLSKDKLGSGKVGWMVSVYPNNCRYDSCWHDNPVDACVEMIIKLHELKLV